MPRIPEIKEEYRHHRIVIVDMGTTSTLGSPPKQMYHVKIFGRLNRGKDYDHKIEKGISSSPIPVELIDQAKKVIDEAYQNLEQDALFDREQTLNHFKHFRSQLKSEGLKDEEAIATATALTSAQMQKECIMSVEATLWELAEQVDDLDVAVERISNRLMSFNEIPIASVFERYFDHLIGE